MASSMDISTDLFIQRHNNGVKLVCPDHLNRQSVVGYSLASILKIPLNIYAFDLDNKMQFSNDQNSRLCGFVSNKDALGQPIHKIADRNTAIQLICNNKLVIKSNAPKIIDESLTRFDGFHISTTTFKFPCYNEKNNFVGIFGCSIPLNYDNQSSLSQSLTQLLNMGLLNAPANKSDLVLPGFMIENTYFTKREKDILFHLVRGKSAREISLIFGISKRTIETHISNVKNKLGVNTKSELIAKIFNLF